MIKGKPREVKVPQGIDSNKYENFKKIFNNEMEYYEKNWPYNHPEGTWQIIVSMFWGFQIVRRIIGGRWVRSPYLSKMWLPINKNFPEELIEVHEFENWSTTHDRFLG